MKRCINTIIKTVFTVAATLAMALSHAQTPTNGNVNFSALPPSNSESAPPIVMLTMSRDHQYFFKAYNDFSDLDPENNNGIETTYTNTITYFGYFQADVCYSYYDNVFVPSDLQNTPFYCDDVSGDWSGNFLNWVSMTRIDIVRKVLYGGKRVKQTVNGAATTVLERAYIPADAHAYAKYYNGDDISRLTPFTSAQITNDGDDEDEVNEGITICNLTQYDDTTINRSGNTDDRSDTNTSPPIMRFAKGNFRLWASNERYMCNWAEGASGSSGTNGVRGPSNPQSMEIGGVDTGTFTFEGVEHDISLEKGDSIDVSSGIDSSPTSPGTSDELTVGGERDIIVRVQPCIVDSGGGLVIGDSCREYPGSGGISVWQPAGLLQRFGEEGLMKFGLITGSYKNNTQGGTLRKNVSDFSDEVNVDTDGSFTLGAESIVRSIDAFRIYGYSYRNTSYSDCGGNRDDITDSDCRAWGNPISEIYRDSLRYLSGASRPAHSAVDDSVYIPSLAESAIWEKPITTANQCSELSNIVFNGSVSTHDMDAADISIVDLGATGNVDSWIDKVGSGENINGNKFFVGQATGNANEQCTSKTVAKLSKVRGLCPEGPSKEGGYGLSGLAYLANQTDLYPSIDGEQTVNTYGIALASSDPVVEVPIVSGAFAGQTVTIIPASIQYEGSSGAMVDFQVVKTHSLLAGETDKYFGKVFVSYEVSVAGNDYDTDAVGTLEYVLDESDGTITVTTVALTESAGSTAGLFGFVIGGTTQDGFQAYSGDKGGAPANYTSTTPGVPGCTNCQSLKRAEADNIQYGPRSHTFSLGNSNTRLLESPLYYASKWGNFDDINNDGTPDNQNEWDQQDNFTGNTLNGGDGVPDNYFLVANPAQLEVALANTFQKILANRTSSGTAPANLANADGSGGIIVQAIYYDKQASATTDESVSWTGELHAFFIDEFGFFREDNRSSGIKGELDGAGIDRIFTFNYDAVNEVLNINRFNLQNNALPFDPTTNPLVLIETVPAIELETVWSADDKLSELENSSIDKQRAYDTVIADTGASRHILTWFDKNRNNKVDPGEQMDLTDDMTSETDDAGNSFARYLGFKNENGAKKVINFVRGKDGVNGLRSRLLTDRVSDGSQKQVVKRLGDVVNSTPLIVGAPTGAFDLRFGDSSYADFRAKYANRRSVMYIGGNDGLLHAFNVGYRAFSADSRVSFTTQDPTDASTVAHDLGDELWAYAPYNLLPHLRWQSQPFYSHVFYVDGDPVSYDVNIFDDDEDHPNGWGTILVVGMRLGGGQIGMNLDDDNSNNISNGCKDWCARSAYVVLDITNPEKPPKVIAEINDNLNDTIDPDTGVVTGTGNDVNHTNQRPVLVKERVAGPGNNWLSPAVNKWSLVFGSGPKQRGEVATNEAARIYKYDLNSETLAKKNVKRGGSNVPRSFVGDLITTDWNEDYKDDVVYFGTVGKDDPATVTGDGNTGQVYRYRVEQEDTNMFYDASRPVSTQPLARRTRSQNFVYFGTGRYYYQDDNETYEQEKYYGLKESNTSDFGTSISVAPLDVSGIEVLRDTSLNNAPTGVETFGALVDYIKVTPSVAGWSRDLDKPLTGSSERVSSESTAVRSQLLFTSFTPTDDICSANSGNSSLFVLDLVTGTASAFGGLGFDSTDPDAVATTSLDLGNGRASFPIVQAAAGLDANKGIVIIQLDTGEIVTPEVLLGEPVRPQRLNWREIRGN